MLLPIFSRFVRDKPYTDEYMCDFMGFVIFFSIIAIYLCVVRGDYPAELRNYTIVLLVSSIIMMVSGAIYIQYGKHANG